MTEHNILTSFTPGSSFVAPDRDETYIHNDEALAEFLDKEHLTDEALEDVIQRAKIITAGKIVEEDETSPTTPRAAASISQPQASAISKPGKKKCKGKQALLPSEMQAIFKKAAEDKVKKREEEEEKRKRQEEAEAQKAKKEAEKKGKTSEDAFKSAEEETVKLPKESSEEEDKRTEKGTSINKESSESELWDDDLDIASHDPHHAEGEGMYQTSAPLLSVTSTQAADMKKDIEALNIRVDATTVKGQSMDAQLKALLKSVEEIRLANNQFQIDMMAKIRALERKLAHDGPRTTSAAELHSKIIPSGSVPTSAPSTEPEKGASSASILSFAERLKAAKEKASV